MKTKRVPSYSIVTILLTICSSLLSIQSVDINALVNKMTIEDKCGQMTQVNVGLVLKDQSSEDENDLIDIEKLRIALKDYKIGSLLGIPTLDAEVTQKVLKSIQDFALNKTDHGIPIIYGTDSIHGVFIDNSVLFPQPISWASTFNKDLVEKIGEVIAKETRALGIPWNFSPVLDIGRMPVWPR